MFSLRIARQPSFLRSIAGPTRATTSPRATAASGRRFASSDYGSGAQKPGTPNNAVDQEHPGPAPPSAAQQGKGGQQQQQEQPSQSQQQSDSTNKSKSDAQPKILSANPPVEGEEPEDVAKHNREMDQRADRAHAKARNADAQDDKVPKGFWSGQDGKGNGS